MQITEEDMQKYGHKDDWNVNCLYLHDVQRMFADKLREATEPLIADVVAFERKAGIGPKSIKPTNRTSPWGTRYSSEDAKVYPGSIEDQIGDIPF